MKKLASNIDFIKDDRAQIITIDGVRVDYPNGWGLVRPSNTTPCFHLLKIRVCLQFLVVL
jgi:phosphomannomutase/phosphoglucomutase